jgi:regulator of extracellular matrix RemA (YlzA/DUF370 family)
MEDNGITIVGLQQYSDGLQKLTTENPAMKRHLQAAIRKIINEARKRIIQDAKERGTLIDATHGRRTRAVIITDSDHIILTYLQSETVAHRLSDENAVDDEEEQDD